MTLMADPTSLFALMLGNGYPLRPSRNTYLLDYDSSHFKFILNYLRNGAHVDICMLPHEKGYPLKLLMESQLDMLSGLEDIILARPKQVTRCHIKYNWFNFFCSVLLSVPAPYVFPLFILVIPLLH